MYVYAIFIFKKNLFAGVKRFTAKPKAPQSENRINYAPVAQLDRVFGYEPKGRGFESLLAWSLSKASPLANMSKGFLYS